jgi:hypothetical protein
MCPLVQVCDAVHAGANFFVLEIGSHAGTKKTNHQKSEIAKSQCAEFLKCAGAKNKIVASRSRTDCASTSRDLSRHIANKAARLVLHASRCTATKMHS